MIKCVITDIDQTLTNKSMQLSEKTKRAIQKAQEKGIRIILCSGRPYQGMKGYINDLNLRDSSDICFGFNGGVIYKNRTGECLKSTCFTIKEVCEIINYLKNSNINFHIESAKAIYTIYNPISYYTLRDSFLTNMPLNVVDIDGLKRNDICKIMVADEENKLNRFKFSIFTEKYKFVRSRPYYLEIIPRNVDKGLAVYEATKRYKLKKSEIMGIGDGLNDLELLQESGLAVAMENGEEKLKNIADRIAFHHDVDGFAKILEEIMMEQ